MTRLRDDILVSVCFPHADAPQTALARLARLAGILRARYRYWEIVVVNEIGLDPAFEEALIALPNLRHLSVVRGLDTSQRRVVAASEAIGDVVVVTSLDEVDDMDVAAMIDAAQAQGAVILGERGVAAIAEPLIVALGQASGFRASTRDMQTVAIPRTVLNRLLSDPNPILALRFPPRDNTVTVRRVAPRGGEAGRRSRLTDRARASTRLDLLMRMVTEAGPAFLGTVALLSAVMVVGALLFGLYVVAVYLFKAEVAEGWTTLSLAVAGMLSFLGTAVFAICITLRKVAETTRGRTTDYLVAERSSVDLFESVAHALNVDTDGHDPAPAPAAQDHGRAPAAQDHGRVPAAQDHDPAPAAGARDAARQGRGTA